MGRNLGLLQAASVRTTEKDANGRPVEITVGRGGELPDNIAPGEEKRLEDAGAFDAPPRGVTVTIPEAQVALTGYLPPQVTLAANNDDGTPADLVASLAAPPPDFLVGGEVKGGRPTTEPAKETAGRRSAQR